jgi:dihydroneopterin aldolase
MKKFVRSKLAVAKLFIHQLNVSTIIGVLPQEKVTPQNLIIDLEINIDIDSAVQTDQLSSTIDYTELRQFVINYVSASRFQLIEALAGHLANELIRNYALTWLRLSVTKKPWDMPDVQSVAVVIEQSALT